MPIQYLKESPLLKKQRTKNDHYSYKSKSNYSPIFSLVHGHSTWFDFFLFANCSSIPHVFHQLLEYSWKRFKKSTKLALNHKITWGFEEEIYWLEHSMLLFALIHWHLMCNQWLLEQLHLKEVEIALLSFGPPAEVQMLDNKQQVSTEL